MAFCISFLPLDLILLTKRQVKSVAVYQYLLIASFFFKRRHFDFKPNLFYLSCFGSTVLAAVISINRHEINFFFKKSVEFVHESLHNMSMSFFSCKIFSVSDLFFPCAENVAKCSDYLLFQSNLIKRKKDSSCSTDTYG